MIRDSGRTLRTLLGAAQQISQGQKITVVGRTEDAARRIAEPVLARIFKDWKGWSFFVTYMGCYSPEQLRLYRALPNIYIDHTVEEQFGWRLRDNQESLRRLNDESIF